MHYRDKKGNSMKYIAIVILICVCSLGFVAFQDAKGLKTQLFAAQSTLIAANKDSVACWKGANEMAYARQHDFKEMAMKTDVQIKQKIFQQGLLAGALSITENIPIPTSYDDFERFQKDYTERKIPLIEKH